jgi:hypothetical protein
MGGIQLLQFNLDRNKVAKFQKVVAAEAQLTVGKQRYRGWQRPNERLPVGDALQIARRYCCKLNRGPLAVGGALVSNT